MEPMTLMALAALASAGATAYSASRPKPGPTGGGGTNPMQPTTGVGAGTRLSEVLKKAVGGEPEQPVGAKFNQAPAQNPATVITQQSNPTNPFSATQPTAPQPFNAQSLGPPTDIEGLQMDEFAGTAAPNSGPQQPTAKPSGQLGLNLQPNSAFTSPNVDVTSGINRFGNMNSASNPVLMQPAQNLTPVGGGQSAGAFPNSADYFNSAPQNQAAKGGVPVDFYSTPANEGPKDSNWVEYAKLASDLGSEAYSAMRPKPSGTGGPGSTAYNPTVPTSRERLSYLLDAVKRRGY